VYIYEPWVPAAGRGGAESDAGVEKGGDGRSGAGFRVAVVGRALLARRRPPGRAAQKTFKLIPPGLLQ
jgi:hypothetical protein